VIPRIAMAAGIVLLAMGSAVPHASAQLPSASGGSPVGSRAAGDALRLFGSGDGTRLDALRRGYLLAVHAPESLLAFRDELDAFESSAGAEGALEAGASKALLGGYRGALDVLRARDARWPPTRLTHLERGLERLDAAVDADPWSAEIRALRLMTETHLPGLFRRDAVIRADETFLDFALGQPGHDLTPGMERIVRGFLERK